MPFPAEPFESQNEESARSPGLEDGSLVNKIVRFKDLARCGDEIWIEHSGQLYRLRETRNGKLILTK